MPLSILISYFGDFLKIRVSNIVIGSAFMK